jgi:hypothetical protein
MSKLILFNIMSIDGFFEGPGNWPSPRSSQG